MKQSFKIGGQVSLFASALVLNLIFFTSIMSNAQTITHGFKLIEKRFVKEVNAECFLYEHVKSGARLFKIASSDENKTFSINFKTTPTSDNGVAHIMEHSVLNGSKNFPVKSPFDVLSKGSLKTFLNAMTSKDITMYPFASMNDKDYFNLMHVYLDAVLNPLIYTETRILEQEGWHYELTDKDAPVTIKGVVYNEMKGAFSNPSRDVTYNLYKNLFPDNIYGNESGGYPSAITTLTQEEFVAFHKKYYHPENSYIYIYGNGNLDKEMEFIDREYLSKYTRLNNKAIINDQKGFAAMKDVNAYYSVMEGDNTKDKTFLSLSLVAGYNTDYALTMALDIICEALINQESAPVRLALEKAGIGQDVSASLSDFKQNIISITVKNANLEDKAKFKEIVISTLTEAVKKGIDKKDIQGILNRMEFQLREGNDAQKGLSYMNQIHAGWVFAENPFLGLEYEKTLTAVKQSLTSNYLEKIIEKYFLNNNHSLLLAVEPKPGLDKEKNAKLEQDLKDYKAKLDEKAINSLVQKTKELIAFQKREDTPEALATIPMLSLSDINPKATWYGCEEKQADGTKVLHYPDFTNNIIYCDLYFDMNTLPKELIPYASLLSNILTSLNTEKYTYGELNQLLNINTGGFYTSLNTYLESQDDNKMIAKFGVSSKVINTGSTKMFELVAEILNHTKYIDTERLKAVLVRQQSQLDSYVKRDGLGIATTRLSSYMNNEGMFDELTNGLEYYWFVTKLLKDFDKNANQIAADLKKVADLLFTKENMIATTTCSKDDYAIFAKELGKFKKLLPSAKPVVNAWKFDFTKKNEGILTASKVQYVIAGYNLKKIGYQWDGKLRVLNQIMSTDWLKNQIRVIGGAYGGFSSISTNGDIVFNSYRDPNLKSTIDNYNGTPNYLSTFEADDKTMTRYIIGTISKIDVPTTPRQRGGSSIIYYFSKRSLADIQKDRDAILSTKVSDIKGYSKLISDILSQKAICVYGNEDKIKAEKENLNELIKIDL